MFCAFDNGVVAGAIDITNFGSGKTDTSLTITRFLNYPWMFNEKNVFLYAISDDNGLGRAINVVDKLWTLGGATCTATS
jgi:hypothetical protein